MYININYTTYSKIYGGCSKFLYLQTAILLNSFIFRWGLMLKYVAKSFVKK